jgi:hypothetical protein
MKIVQSMWMKPSLKKTGFSESDRNKGGWLDKRYNYFSWALSCLQFRTFYEEVELVTDALGYDLLIEKMGLPYTNVRVELDMLDKYHPDLWALGKIYTYSIQEHPFIHADGDVYIWEKLAGIEQVPLVAQNLDNSFAFYGEIFLKIAQKFHFIPDVLWSSASGNNKILAVNAGVLGGSDLSFFKEYTRQAFEMIERNYDKLEQVDIGMFNVIFEQFLFRALAELKEVPVHFVLNDVNYSFDGLTDLTGVPGRVKYVHPVGLYKRSRYIGELVAYHLHESFPDYYFRIVDLLTRYEI